MQTLTNTIFHTMFCGWTLNTRMENGEYQKMSCMLEHSKFHQVCSVVDSLTGFKICNLVLSTRYMTWDSAKFPNPEEMQNKLADKGRRVCTVLPRICFIPIRWGFVSESLYLPLGTATSRLVCSSLRNLVRMENEWFYIFFLDGHHCGPTY